MGLRVVAPEGTSVDPAGIPNAYQTTPGALGEAGMSRARLLGQGAQAAQAYGAMQREEQNRQDIDTVFRAETGLKDDYLKFEREELGKLGADAKGAGERLEKWWQESQGKYADGMTERQKFAFMRSATALRQAGTSTLGRHEQHQARESLKESSQARVGTAIELAVGDPTPERVAQARKEISEAVGIGAKAAGLPPEAAQAKLSDALTLMHRNITLRLVDTDPDAAKAYYYTHKKEVSGSTQATLEKTLEHGGRLQKAQEAADTIMQQFADPAAAMKHIEDTYGGEDEKEIKAEVYDRFTKVEAAKNMMSGKAYDTAKLHVVQGQRVPAAVWSQMDDGHKAQIIEKREAEAKQRRAEAEGRAVKTDFATWDTLNRMVTTDPKAFINYDLGRVADRISRGDLQELGNLQRKIRAGGDEAKDVVTLQQQIGTTVDQLRLTGRENTERRGMLEHKVVEAIRSEQRAKGKPLNDEERQKIIDRNVMEVTVDRPWYQLGDATRRAFELTPEELAQVVVPDADRKLIIEALTIKGRKVDEATIRARYLRQKGLQ
jgi:hypothetical protein